MKTENHKDEILAVVKEGELVNIIVELLNGTKGVIAASSKRNLAMVSTSRLRALLRDLHTCEKKCEASENLVVSIARNCSAQKL
jgi:hypothetical protein